MAITATRTSALGEASAGRVVSIHQPAYLPWLGYFDKIRRADRFVYLDTVQFQKQSFQNRNKIRTADGWTWLTVPVETKGVLYETPLKDLRINNRVDWRRKHLRAIEMHYRKAPRFAEVMPLMEGFLGRDWDRLADLCFDMLTAFNRLLGIETEVLRASALSGVEGGKSDLILNLCRHLGATQYLSGTLGRNYLDEAAFEAAGIELRYQDYAHPVHAQAYDGFEPYMGVIDLLMNEPDPAGVIEGRA
ncbi:MAG: WbqC family protein [Kiloniellales bacterium]|nr:WbqC family protein [Kiloniellales bacterium]